MSNYHPPDQGDLQEGRVRGARRQKVYGYLKAANELRQSYHQQWKDRHDDDDQGIPGAFPDVEIVRSGDEEMVLFPSYARKHIKKHPPNLQGSRDIPGSHDDIEHPDSGDAEYWRREWEKYEDDSAVVDVDVRGWIYSPHKGPLNRKNRLLIAVARRLSGVPAPANSPESGTPSDNVTLHEQLARRNASVEDEAAAREARKLIERGEAEAQTAWRGGYSEASSRDYDSDTPPDTKTTSPGSSRHPSLQAGRLRHSLTDTEFASEDEDLSLNSLTKRQSWNQPAQMSPEELKTANAHLMARLKPFMTIPLANTSITVFFFNDDRSQSRSVHTNESGHFNLRASLDFIPIRIRVLASENLSATEKVIVTEDKGISLVSDIDDTIKHSAITSGAREIFKNTFIRELGDLTIQGVKEWYNKMAELGVKLHYVSNSPWQLYPLLRSYFSLAGLPAGSFHLKHYTGMLQGIFEPAAERKRGSLEKIMHDFPERKFILVGDSGEADLEVYSDVVAENPGRVLAVFIRDVTTAQKKKFFDQAVPNAAPDSRVAPRNGTAAPVRKQEVDDTQHRPVLPSRLAQTTTQQTGDLIDFSDEAEPVKRSDDNSYSTDLLAVQAKGEDLHKTPPGRPNKPPSLRGGTVDSRRPSNHNRIESSKELTTSPVDSRDPSPNATLTHLPSTTAHTKRSSHPPSSNVSSASQPLKPPPPPQSRSRRPHLPHRHTSHKHPPPPTKPKAPEFFEPAYQHASGTQSDTEGEGYAATARRQLVSAYNALPSLSAAPSTQDTSNVPRPPPRRGLTSYPAAAARYVAGAAMGTNSSTDAYTAAEALNPYNKKEEIWRRRWARAEELMRSQGVVLRSWRVGQDVMDEAVRIVERGKEELERESGRRGGVSLTMKMAEREREGRAASA